MSHALSWVRNRKTAQKLAALADVLGLFLAVVGAVGVIQTGKLAANTEHMYTHDVELLEEVDQIRSVFNRIRIHTLRHVG